MRRIKRTEVEKIKNLMRYGLDRLIYADELFQEKHLETIWPREVTKSTDILDLISSYRKDGGFQIGMGCLSNFVRLHQLQLLIKTYHSLSC